MPPANQAFDWCLAASAVPIIRCTGSCAMNSSVAKRIRNGTSLSKTPGGVSLSSHAPASPPIRLGITISHSRGATLRASRLYPHALPTVPGQMATVLVALAVTEFSPSQMSAGNEINVPPPATEFTAPARNAATNDTAACGKVMDAIKWPAYRTLAIARHNHHNQKIG